MLYLGNLYSLIIALLDKVNSMSSAVSHISIPLLFITFSLKLQVTSDDIFTYILSCVEVR